MKFHEVPAYDAFDFAPKANRYCVCVFVINEGEKLGRQLEKMRGTCHGVADVVVADGGSTDGSTEHGKLRSLGVRTLLVKTGAGKLGSQMRMAFDWALRQGYAGVISIDGNGKDGVEAIGRFAAELDKGMDHVQGSRFVPGGYHENTPKSRLLGVKLLHAPLLRLASGFHYTDTTNGFRAYSARLLGSEKLEIFRDCFSGYELHYYLALKSACDGFACREIPVSRVYPPSGKIPTKISPVRGNLNVLKKLFATVLHCYDPDKPNRRWPLGVLLTGLGVLLTALLVTVCGWSEHHNKMAVYNPASVPSGYFTASTVITQEFTARASRLDGVFVMLGNGGTVPRGDLQFTLRDGSGGRELAKYRFDMSYPDNTYVLLKFPVRINSRGKKYQLELRGSPDCRSGNTVAVYLQRSAELPPAVIDGQVQSAGSLHMLERYGSGVSWKWPAAIILLTLGAALAAALLQGRYHPESRRQRALFFGVLLLAGVIFLVVRNHAPLAMPQLYAEDGSWVQNLLDKGFWYSLVHTRPDYFVWGNILLLQGALSGNRLFFGDNLAALPYFVYGIQLSFYVLTALLPFLLLRRIMGLYWQLLFFVLALCYPMIGEGGYEIFGRILNTGFLFYFWSFVLLLYWFDRSAELRGAAKYGVAGGVLLLLLLCCGTNPASYFSILLFAMATVLSHIKWESRDWEIQLKLRNAARDFRFWALLFFGICAFGVLCVQKWLLPGEIIKFAGRTAGNGELLLEAVSRPFFFCAAPFYEFLDGEKTSLMLCIIVLLLLAAWLLSGWRQRGYMLLTFAATVFYLTITLIYRPIFDWMWQYRSAFPMRYFYGIGFMLLLLFVMALSGMVSRRGMRWGWAAFLLAGYLLGTALLLRGSFYTPVIYKGNGSWADSVAGGVSDGKTCLVNIPPQWQVRIPRQYAEATRKYVESKKR